MNLTTFNELRSDIGQKALRDAAELGPNEETLLASLTRLQKLYPADLARAGIETVLLRKKAAAKFDRADAMYFTRTALEQASSETVARHRARRFEGLRTVGDFCCGIGGDALALASRGAIVAVDTDPVRLAMAAANLEVYGVRQQARFVEGDVASIPLTGLDAVFFDPDRRARGRRVIAIDDYQPTLAAVQERLPGEFPLGVKVAPGVKAAEIDRFNAEAEFISLHGELKECVLWFGRLRTTRRRATILPNGASMTSDGPAQPLGLALPKRYLYDPDPAITRAGLVTDLARQLDAKQIDEEIAFLTSDTLHATPFARAYVILESLPFSAKQLAKRLRARDIGSISVVKRGSAVDADELSRRMKGRGNGRATVVLTRVAGQPFALIAEAIPGS